MQRSIITPFTLALTLACTNGPGVDDEAGTTTSPTTTDTGESTDDGSTSTSDGDTTEDTESTSSADDVFTLTGVDTFEDGWFGDECNAFDQDCPEGEKCVFYASMGGTWDALKCVQVLGDGAAGDACTYDGPLESTDDCDATTWCWDPDGDGQGVCRPFCMGTVDMPECPPMSQCTISDDGVVTICLPTCDPVLQECPDGEACYWTGTTFFCVEALGQIPTGEPCSFINDCAEGNMCVDAGSLPACDGQGCCTNFCDVNLGDAQCMGFPGTMCVPFFEQGQAPPDFEHVGVCVVP